MDEPGLITAPPAPRTGRNAAFLMTAAVLGALLGAALAFAAAAWIGLWNPLAALSKGRSTRIDTSQPSVVDKIRQLNRLESVDYSIDKIVEGNRESPSWPSFLAGDRLLLVAHGEVIAGVDMAKLGKDDVRMNGTTVRVRLPAPEILSTRVDNSRTRVYERTTGLLVPPDPNLETQVRATAEQEITKAALSDGILDKARENARVNITGLLYGLGFRNVDVE